MSDLATRLRDDLMAEYSYSCAITFDSVLQHCESPIEALFGSAILLAMRMPCDFSCVHFTPLPYPAPKTATLLLTPQYPWRSYRIDWVIRSTKAPVEIFVECDGHDFHERTKEQAARDRSRDREVTEAGIPLLRFTGSEIYRNPGACGFQTLMLIDKLEEQQNGRC